MNPDLVDEEPDLYSLVYCEVKMILRLQCHPLTVLLTERVKVLMTELKVKDNRELARHPYIILFAVAEYIGQAAHRVDKRLGVFGHTKLNFRNLDYQGIQEELRVTDDITALGDFLYSFVDKFLCVCAEQGNVSTMRNSSIPNSWLAPLTLMCTSTISLPTKW